MSNKELKFFYDEIDVQHEKKISWWWGFTVGAVLSLIAEFAALAWYGSTLPN